MAASMDVGHNGGTVQLLNTVEVPHKYYRRITTGAEVLDLAFGGDVPGMLPGSSILLTGFPGAGKSTLGLQLADLVSRQGRRVLYNANEQNRYIVKMAADRIRLQGEFRISDFENVDELLDYVERDGIEFFIQDSLQTVSCGNLTGTALLKKVGEKLVKFCDRTGITCVIIGQITKGGEMAGPMILKHLVDVHAHMTINTASGNRVFELLKNRFGPAMIPYEFFLGAQGLDLKLPEGNLVESQNKTRGGQMREAVKDKAKELLLKGELLSGYSSMEHSELASWLLEHGHEISGSFWRGVMAMAISELEREGHRFSKIRKDRKEHVRLEV